ncbi:MAG TPA: sulfurtransferase [Nitratifractor sp.]|nr:sulfurtransferase [Nitratifractor sp.]
MTLSKRLAAAAIAAIFVTGAFAADTPKNKKRQTKAGLYVDSKEAVEFINKNKDKIVFIDVRTRPEVEYVGYADLMDKNIPWHFKNWEKWNEKKHRFADEPKNANFVADVEAAVKAKGLTKEDAIVLLMCRSGSRSAKAANALFDAGFKQPYSLVDGFEGGKSKKTKHRTVSGWKNAGNPWTYKLVKEKMYLK